MLIFCLQLKIKLENILAEGLKCKCFSNLLLDKMTE